MYLLPNQTIFNEIISMATGDKICHHRNLFPNATIALGVQKRFLELLHWITNGKVPFPSFIN